MGISQDHIKWTIRSYCSLVYSCTIYVTEMDLDIWRTAWGSIEFPQGRLTALPGERKHSCVRSRSIFDETAKCLPMWPIEMTGNSQVILIILGAFDTFSPTFQLNSQNLRNFIARPCLINVLSSSCFWMAYQTFIYQTLILFSFSCEMLSFPLKSQTSTLFSLDQDDMYTSFCLSLESHVYVDSLYARNYMFEYVCANNPIIWN